MFLLLLLCALYYALRKILPKPTTRPKSMSSSSVASAQGVSPPLYQRDHEHDQDDADYELIVGPTVDSESDDDDIPNSASVDKDRYSGEYSNISPTDTDVVARIWITRSHRFMTVVTSQWCHTLPLNTFIYTIVTSHVDPSTKSVITKFSYNGPGAGPGCMHDRSTTCEWRSNSLETSCAFIGQIGYALSRPIFCPIRATETWTESARSAIQTSNTGSSNIDPAQSLAIATTKIRPVSKQILNAPSSVWFLFLLGFFSMLATVIFYNIVLQSQ